MQPGVLTAGITTAAACPEGLDFGAAIERNPAKLGCARNAARSATSSRRTAFHGPFQGKSEAVGDPALKRRASESLSPSGLRGTLFPRMLAYRA
jgi:hypothetical protein